MPKLDEAKLNQEKPSDLITAETAANTDSRQMKEETVQTEGAVLTDKATAKKEDVPKVAQNKAKINKVREDTIRSSHGLSPWLPIETLSVPIKTPAMPKADAGATQGE